MKLIIFSTVFIIGIVFLIPLLLSLGIKDIPGSTQLPLDRKEYLLRDVSISQTFNSTVDNLSGIGLSVANPQMGNKNDVIVNLYDNRGQILRTSVVNGAYIQDGKFVKFLFEPIPNSKEQTYTIRVSSLHLDSRPILDFEVYYSINKTDQDLTLKIGDKIEQGSLAYVPFYRSNNPLNISKQIYKEWFGRYFQDKLFAVIYIILILSGISYLLYPRKEAWINS